MMDGVLVLLNEAGLAIQQLRAGITQRDQRIAELEQQLAEAQPPAALSGEEKQGQ